MPRPLLAVLLSLALAPPLLATSGDAPHLARFAAGDGPRQEGEIVRLLDAARTPGQSNAAAWDATSERAHESLRVTGRLRVESGGDGGALVLLSTAEHGARGPAPFVADWTAPNLAGSFAVGIDVHDPPNDEPFGPWGNVLGNPEREVSLHWDGRELVKRVTASEFRDEWVAVELVVQHVVGGAEVGVRLGDEWVYEEHFIANMRPYRCRLALGAGTRADLATSFDVEAPTLTLGEPAARRRPPLHVEVFNHVLTDNGQTSYEAEVDLPPEAFAFDRVLLTLQIHDAGPDWDEWDRNGDLFVRDPEGTWRVLVPFITSYRTECHWVVDVTPFRPWLAGRTAFRIAAGTTFYKDRGYMLSVDLDFHHAAGAGTGDDAERALVPLAVTPLWDGRATHGSAENHFQDFFTDLEVPVPDATRAARIYVATTGHSQVGEFTPSRRTLTVLPDVEGDADALSFENRLWKDDCYLNPNRPQFGTWKYPRAGWAPGDVVAPWWIELGDALVPGATARFSYTPHPYEFPEGQRPDDGAIGAAHHVVRSYLISYGTAAGRMPAPVLRVTNVQGDSAAARAGIQAGDYLARYDDVAVDSVAQLGEAKQGALDAGRERVAVVVYRGTERLDLEMDAGQMGVNLSAR